MWFAFGETRVLFLGVGGGGGEYVRTFVRTFVRACLLNSVNLKGVVGVGGGLITSVTLPRVAADAEISILPIENSELSNVRP